MLEKIGLPAKPSLRGNSWVVDASHCQGCSSQFTFINRKHHCRRCGGLFCNSCTQQRMILRGQGDAPVRICDPCKKLEEAARFEMRYGHKSKAGKGSMRTTSKYEDEILNQILGNDRKEPSSSGQLSNDGLVSSIQKASSSASHSNAQAVTTLDCEGGIRRSHSVDEHNDLHADVASTSPEELRQRASDEKKKYKILKGERKSEEALRAFKRGKELERQADALELSIRKNRRKVLSVSNTVELQNDQFGLKGSGRKSKRLAQVGNDKDDLSAELRELGWSDMDLHEKDKKTAKMSLEGELSSLLGEISGRTDNAAGNCGIDKTQVVVHKRKALALKREGKLTEAKEELKKAKVLEKQLEEQELLGMDEESDDEISALIRSMDDDNEDRLLAEHELSHGFDFDHLLGTADDLDSNFEVTDEDLVNPELAATLKSLGWNDDSDSPEATATHSVPVDREALQSEILSLKRAAVSYKRAGNVAEAMTFLKKAKLLERDLESLVGEADSLIMHNSTTMEKDLSSQTMNANNNTSSIPARKSRLMIQKELLALKKKALSLRREGRLDEAEEELKKSRVLEQQLEEMDNAANIEKKQVTVGGKKPDLVYEHPHNSGSPPVTEGEEDVTDQDMHDPAYLSLLRNLGWKDDDNEQANSQFNPPKESDNHSTKTVNPIVSQTASSISMKTSRRSKAEIQRELLGLKRKALTLRREGKTDEADEVLIAAKALEAQMAEMETQKKEIQFESNRLKEKIVRPISSEAEEGDIDDITEEDMHDPALLSMLTNLGWKDDEVKTVTEQAKPSKQISDSSVHSTDPSPSPSSSEISVTRPRSRDEIQRELLGLKRKALALRRKGETEEADELLKMARVLESQVEKLEDLNKDHSPDASEGKTSRSSELLINHEKQNYMKIAVETSRKLAAPSVSPVEKVDESFTGLERKESDTTAPPSRSADTVNSASFVPDEHSHSSVGELNLLGKMGSLSNSGINKSTDFIPSSRQPVNVMDLLTGDDWRSTQIPAGKLEDKVDFGSDVSRLSEPHVHAIYSRSQPENLRSKDEEVKSISDGSYFAEPLNGSLIHAPKNLGSKENVRTEKREATINDGKKPDLDETDSVLHLSSQNNQNSLKQEVLACKRRAVALKREGKLAEAREELRQAKLLEKSLEEQTLEPAAGRHDGSISSSSAPPVQLKDPGAPNMAPKPLSGRDRFKLQQQSLSHKRQALKLRREGRMEEAEAKFEMAKALEAQLEEMSSNDSAKSSVNLAEPVDDIVVEDLLDPQLLSALKAIGIEDTSFASQGSEKPGLVKVSPTKSEDNTQERGPAKVSPTKSKNNAQERVQLEELIKAEKLKAVNLKRSGKQGEALDALRRSKLYEKKLNSLA